MNQSDVVLGAIGSVVTIGMSLELTRRRHLRGKYAIFWIALALATLIVALFPTVLYAAADVLGVAVPANLLFFVASMTLLAISLQHSHELSRLEERTRVLAEEVALIKTNSLAPASTTDGG